MPGAASGRGPTAWFVRRAGLARCTTIACTAGLSLAAVFSGRYLVAFTGLALALGGILAGYVLSRLRPLSDKGLAVTLASVVLMGLLSGFLLGTVRVSSLLDGGLSSQTGETVQAEIVVTGPVRSNAGWQSATAVIQTISGVAGRTEGPRGGVGAGEKVLLEVAPTDTNASADRGSAFADESAGRSLTQGALLAVKGVLRAPEGPSASGFDQAKQLLHQGIQVVLRVEGSAGLSFRGQRGGVSGWFDHLRASAKEHLSLGPDPRVNEVLQGVVMGDTAGIDQGWMDAFRRSGTAHMLSVSGLHVACLAAIIIALAGYARLSRKAGFVLAAAAAVLMVPFVGSSPPILRSAVMIVVVLGGRLVGRRRDQWQGLAFAALIVLMLNPFAIFDVGFQLSFCAFAGMIALVKPAERLLHGLPDSVRANLAVSVAATLGTAPVSLLVFGRTSLISPLANLLVVPTLASVTGLGMASVLLGFVWRGFSAGLDTLASLPMSWTILVSTLCARAPVLGAGDVGRVLFAITAGALVLPVALALSGRAVGPPFGLRLPAFGRSVSWVRAHRPRDRRRGAALGAVSVIVALALGAACYPAVAAGLRSAELFAGERGWPTQVEVRVLDVGQGTAVLVRTPEHHAALFDAGPAGCALAGQLRSLGVTRLDLVVISHPHADHFAGLLEALDSLQVGTFVDRTEVIGSDGVDSAGGAPYAGVGNKGGGEAKQYLQLRRSLEASGCRVLRASPGSTLDVDGVHIVFFGPSRSLALLGNGDPWGEGRDPPSGDEMNGGSLVTVLAVDQARVLLPGDAEADILDSYRLPSLSAVVVPHHGSRGAVSHGLLAGLQGKLALISVGENNTFGHPDGATLTMLAAAGDTIVRTDECGWVSLSLNNAEMTISTERTRAP